jgi:hypothetical protein
MKNNNYKARNNFSYVTNHVYQQRNTIDEHENTAVLFTGLSNLIHGISKAQHFVLILATPHPPPPHTLFKGSKNKL